MARELGHREQTIVVNILLMNLRHTWYQKEYVMSLTVPYSPQRMEWLKEWIEPLWSQLNPWLLMQVYLIVGSSNSNIREELKPKPNVGHLKVFGCIAYAHIPDQQRQNLDKKLKSCDLLAMIRNPKVTYTDWSMAKQWKLLYEEMLCLMKQSLTTVVK